jgi:hypothetical protein
MSQYAITPNLYAGGVIAPMTFVMMDVSNAFHVLQATANAIPVGVTQVGSHDAGGYPGSSANAVTVAGQPLEIFGPGSVVGLVIGTGGCTTGDFLESDSSGRGVTSSVSGHNVGALALEPAAANGVARVLLMNRGR